MQQRQTNRNTRSVNFTLPAPIGGLNARDSLDTMEPTDAIVMDNYIPSETKVALRKGFQKYVAMEDEKVRTLAEFKHPTEPRFFAFAGGNVFNIASKTLIKDYGKEYKTSVWQYCQFKNRMIFVNGMDEPQTFYLENDEDRFETAAFSGDGLVLNKLINVAVSKQRLWFVEKGSLKVWYSEGVSEVQGNLLSFDLSTIATQGGELMAVASWTQDGGQGIDDLTVFITSQGEALVYAGSNPNAADDWTLKGVYQISKPIGYRCTLQYQGDVVIISEDGYIPLSKALPLEKANSSQIAFSDKIRGLVLERTRVSKSKEGWQGIIYGRGGYAIFNVPVYQKFEQHVINVNTGAWCRFTGINAICWGLFQDRIYFGSEGGVFLFDEGYSDDKVHILGHVEQAFSNLGSNNLKKIQLLNPRTKSSTKYALVIYTNMDFEDRNVAYQENIGSYGMTKWNEAKWSTLANPIGTKWATLRGKIRSQWIANSATGFKASLVFKTKTRGNLIEWMDTGFRYEQGSGII